eukprot:TRINITY_DN7061_c0_g1_i6.p1 TRINITY_DN7061_c0_g1~~TRINITY_DN7061_c0_g1_i6.p1  ORF type:complete len:104 (-),score=23.29 TRINITY_DN7061_c0_g1_i6:246-512(-)
MCIRDSLSTLYSNKFEEPMDFHYILSQLNSTDNHLKSYTTQLEDILKPETALDLGKANSALAAFKNNLASLTNGFNSWKQYKIGQKLR